MKTEHISLTTQLNRLRWIVPIVLAIVGVGYILYREIFSLQRPILSGDIFLAFLVLVVVGPVCTWLALSWASGTAQSEAAAKIELKNRNTELAALDAVGEAASQHVELDEILENSLSRVAQLLALEASEIRLFEQDNLVLKAHFGMTPEWVAQNRVVTTGYCLCGTAARTGSCAEIGRAVSESDVHLACARAGFASGICFPMKSGGQTVGVLCAFSRSHDAFAPRDEQILASVSARLAMTIENARLFQATQRHALQMETASLVGQRVTALLDLDALLSEVAGLVRVKFNYDYVQILLVDELAREIVLKAASGISAELASLRELHLPLGDKGITVWVAQTGQALLCNDVRRESRYLAVELLPDTKAELAVPLRVGTRVLGVLDVQSNHFNSFTKEDITVLQILGNQLGIAIENARLFGETKRRYRAMLALHETSLDVISELDRQQLLDELVRRGVHLWEAKAGGLWLYNPSKDVLEVVAHYNYDKDFDSGLVMRPGEGMVGTVFQTRQPMMIEDYPNWPGHLKAFEGTEMTVAMAAPLKLGDQTIGVVSISNHRKMRLFDENDVWLLALFSDLAMIALRNAELHSQIKELNQDLENKVAERTRLLTLAKEELAVKAEQLRTALAKTIHIQEEERARIAREMHDGVIQLITALRYELKAARVTWSNDQPEEALENLSQARELLDEMEQELRHVIYDLHPPALDAVDLVPALQKYTKNFEAISGIACDFRVTGTTYRLPSPLEVAIFRIVEQGLQNVAAHAGASETQIGLDFVQTGVELEIQDNGRGFEYSEIQLTNHNHLGLVSMRERVRNLNGSMDVHSKPGASTRLVFFFPTERGTNPDVLPSGILEYIAP